MESKRLRSYTKTISRRFSVILLIVGGIVLAGCARPTPPAVKIAAPDVIVTTPVTKLVTDSEEFTGRTEAFKYLEVRCRVGGELMKVNFQDGEYVDQGTVLFEIDDRVYKARRDSSKAMLEQAKAQAAKSKVLADNAKKALDSGAIGMEEYLTKVADLDAANAAVDNAKATLVLSQQDLDWTKVDTRYSGRLSKRLVDPGNMVVAATGTASGTLLTTLVELDSIYIGFDIDEQTLERRREAIREGSISTSREQPLEVGVGLANQEGYPNKAKVIFSDNQLDAGTGTLHIRALMENPSLKGVVPAVVGWPAFFDMEKRGLRQMSPNMFVRVKLPMGKPHEALMIPEDSLVSDQGQKFIYVVSDNNEAIYRRVVLGPQIGNLRAIEKGLAANEKVIVKGQQRVKKGVKVNPTFANDTSAKKS